MKNKITVLLTALLAMNACNTNPLLEESALEYGAPQFDRIKAEHYLPAFKKGIEDAKKEIDAIVASDEEPTFENTILALENAGGLVGKVSSIFFNIMEADTSDELQKTAEEVSPLLNEYSMYINLNATLFEKVKKVYDRREELGLADDQKRLLEITYRGFVRQGALLSDKDKKTFSDLQEKLSLAQLRYSKNLLAATNAYTLNITDKDQLSGLPDYVLTQASETAAEHGKQGWTFDLSYPVYGPFMRYADNADLRRQMYLAYSSKALGGENDNTSTVLEITNLRIQIAQLLGYETYADYVLEERMIKTPAEVNSFLEALLAPSLPAAKKEVKQIGDYAHTHGYSGKDLQAWDFSYWSEKYRNEKYDFDENALKPYFQLDSCINAVFSLAGRLYGLQFEERPDLPAYHKDVRVYDVKDRTGRHMALFYADFFPRASKRGGAWMTEFQGLKWENGVEHRPFVSMVTNFTKPTADAPALITHDELCTLLHEFGHCLHAMLSEGRYESLATTNVSTDFVELPSQIMENWAYEKEFLEGFAKHYQTREVIPSELIHKIIETKNYHSAYYQVRQLNFGILDMAWNDRSEQVSGDIVAFENRALARTALFPEVPGTCISTSFSHIFTGQYAAGYYSYKWSEVLEADAFSLFEEKGIFNTEVSESFRANILSRGNTVEPAEMFRAFRGHDPEVGALLKKLGIQ